jgi:hypothetical protein
MESPIVERSSAVPPRYRSDRVYQPVPGIDLSGWAPARARVPALSSSRSALPLRVSASDVARPSNDGRAPSAGVPADRWSASSRASLAHDDAVRMSSEPVSRASILQRYRRAGAQAVLDDGAEHRSTAKSRLESPRVGPLTSQKGSEQRGSELRGVAGTGLSALERAQREERTGIARLTRLNHSNPASARAALRQGEGVAIATSIGVQIAVSTGFGAACGHHNCGWWWASGWTHHSPVWNGCCSSPWWWWGTSSCWWPWWGPCWSYGYWFNHCGFWWNGSPYYAYPYGFYCSPPPIYYSYVIYDTSAPPDEQTVEYQDPAPAAEGEGEIATPAMSDATSAHDTSIGGSQAMNRAVSEYLALGDRAFREARYSDAVYAYAKATEYAPNEGVLHLILSDALLATGDYHYAAYSLRKAIELDPRLIDAQVDKHSFYGDPSEFDRQLALLARYVEDHFVDDDARLLLAANYLFASRPNQAADLLDSAFSLAVRESNAGKVISARAHALAQSRPH